MRIRIAIASLLSVLVLAATVLVVGVLPVAAEDPVSPLSIDDLSWMAGTWQRAEPGQELVETWAAPSGDAMSGMFTWARDDKVWLYELMSIEKNENTLVFYLRHFSRGLVPWKSEADGPLTYPLLEMAANRVVFENPDRDEPRRFIYQRSGDVLTVKLEGKDGKGDSFELKRVE